jgi:hypothetical protein
MCSLFRLQHRFRKGDYVARQNVKKLLPLLDEKAELLPVVRIALHTTHLLLNPCWGSAWYAISISLLQASSRVYLVPSTYIDEQNAMQLLRSKFAVLCFKPIIFVFSICSDTDCTFH